MDRLPLGEMVDAALVYGRRVRRRIARRKGGAVVALGFVVTGALVGGNALWEQDGMHPAPLWGRAEETAFAAHNGAEALEIAGKGDVRAVVAPASETSQMVRAVQEQLQRLDMYDGAASGGMDEVTMRAIEAYERENGLPVTGEPSVGLLAALSAGTPGPVAAPRAAMGTLEMQRRLNAAGYGPLAEDGVMGPQTQRALDAFAADQGLAGAGSADVLRALATRGA